MNDNSKISVGLLIPAVSIIAFISMLFNESYIAALFVAISGLMVWFTYSAVMNAKMPDITGNIVIVFGVLLSVAFFLNYGLSTTMFGGFEIKLEGVFYSISIGMPTQQTLDKTLFLVLRLGKSFPTELHHVDRMPGSSRSQVTIVTDLTHRSSTKNFLVLRPRKSFPTELHNVDRISGSLRSQVNIVTDLIHRSSTKHLF